MYIYDYVGALFFLFLSKTIIFLSFHDHVLNVQNPIPIPMPFFQRIQILFYQLQKRSTQKIIGDLNIADKHDDIVDRLPSVDSFKSRNSVIGPDFGA